MVWKTQQATKDADSFSTWGLKVKTTQQSLLDHSNEIEREVRNELKEKETDLIDNDNSVF